MYWVTIISLPFIFAIIFPPLLLSFLYTVDLSFDGFYFVMFFNGPTGLVGSGAIYESKYEDSKEVGTSKWEHS